MAKLSRAWNTRIDFIGHMRPVLALSGLLCVASLVLVATRGLNFGTDFAGGYELQVRLPEATRETQIREKLAPLGLDDARVQRFGAEEEHAFLIMVRGDFAALTGARAQALRQAVTALSPGDKPVGFTLAENGEALTVDFPAPVAEAALAQAVTSVGLEVKKVQAAGRAERPTFTVSWAGLADKIADALVGEGAEGRGAIERIDFVGPQVGGQLRSQGLLAVVYALGFIFVYIAVRFDMLFSPGAIIATLHDVIITVGVLSLFQIEFSLNVVAAILTLIGFSLNDTIVVYDRIRESVARRPGVVLEELVNRAINDTLSRTILTSGTVLLVTGALLLLGGPFIFGLAITMFIGVVVGTYSSIAVASPLYILLRRRFGGASQAAAGRRSPPRGRAHGEPTLRLSGAPSRPPSS